MVHAKGLLGHITVMLGLRRRLVGQTEKEVTMARRSCFAFVLQPPMLARSSAVSTEPLTLQMLQQLTSHWYHLKPSAAARRASVQETWHSPRLEPFISKPPFPVCPDLVGLLLPSNFSSITKRRTVLSVSKSLTNTSIMQAPV